MDGSRDEVIGWLADSVAAAMFGGALGACLLLLGEPPLAVAAAIFGVLGGLGLLRQVKPEPRRFRLPAFTPDEEVLLLTEVEPLLLVDRLEEPPSDSRVVQMFAGIGADPMTPGEMRRRIEAHLAGSRSAHEEVDVVELEVDAAAALRHALGELRRSLA